MSDENATRVDQAGRFAWARACGVVLSCTVVAIAVESTTAAYARMGENAITTRLELTPGDETVHRFCKLGDACGDDGALTGDFGGVWRDGAFVEPDPRTFPGIRFVGKVLSAEPLSGNPFDVYCSTEGGNQACVKIEDTGVGGGSNTFCRSIIRVENNNTCVEGFDYKVEYGKAPPTVLKTCNPGVVVSCLANDSTLVTNGRIVAHRALFDYDCTRYCYGGCCRF